MKKLSRAQLKSIGGGGCTGPYPPGTGYGPHNGVRTCAAYQALPNCCQIQYCSGESLWTRLRLILSLKSIGKALFPTVLFLCMLSNH
ncbi:hypothetical protein PMI13_01331 [Chryseobacterium populi]|uniref:Bacteriocin n=1 Tax=Chryseobacterium populi TaxID=1144316 RepID=J3CLB2_9FLAO|nr:hypothetical protein PMI13_01331 [Chryseobacterium populi]